MPFYEFKNKETGELTKVLLKMSELDQYKLDNPNLESHITSVAAIGDAYRLGITKGQAGDGWNDVLRKIHNNTPKSNLGDKLSRK